MTTSTAAADGGEHGGAPSDKPWTPPPEPPSPDGDGTYTGTGS